MAGYPRPGCPGAAASPPAKKSPCCHAEANEVRGESAFDCATSKRPPHIGGCDERTSENRDTTLGKRWLQPAQLRRIIWTADPLSHWPAFAQPESMVEKQGGNGPAEPWGWLTTEIASKRTKGRPSRWMRWRHAQR